VPWRSAARTTADPIRLLEERTNPRPRFSSLVLNSPTKNSSPRSKSLAARERHATAALVASLAELDERRLYLGEGYGSLFSYCTRVLHLSEHAAYGRIEVARAVRRFPPICFDTRFQTEIQL
jgi:hypothetical protein